MKTGIFLLTLFSMLVAWSLGITGDSASASAATTATVHSLDGPVFDLSTFGAVGDGVTNDGPALQQALNAIAQAGGGTLFVPAGRYVITTPVLKDFTGTGASLTILGVGSSTPVNADGDGAALTRGLDLTSEFVIRTGLSTTALTLRGLDSLLISEMVFIGTPGVATDAHISLGIYDVANAVIQHCEFYGLSTMLAGGAVVRTDNSRLTIEATVFLGCTGNSGVRNSVVTASTWKDLSVTNTVFADYGQRPDFFGKTGFAAAYSWILVGNTAPVTNLSPRRAVNIRDVFMDEGGFFGIAVVPDFFDSRSPASDLIYISDFRMNVSSLNAAGILINRVKRALIERAQFGLSTRADAAVSLVNVEEATLDKLQCMAAANRIRANAGTGKLRVINSTYTYLDSLSQTTEVISTTDAQDPVQYVRQRYLEQLDHEPDAAGHQYWSDVLLDCGASQTCVTAKRLELTGYLNTEPTPFFGITGKVLKQNNSGFLGVTVNLSGSQAVSTQTDAQGNFRFEGLPTSGIYTVTPVRVNYTFAAPSWTSTTPPGDQQVSFNAILNSYSISGRVLVGGSQALSGVTVTLTGTQTATTTTNSNGSYSFTVPAEGNYTVSAARTHYTFAPPTRSFANLSGNQSADFAATLNRHTITGQITTANGNGLVGVTVSLSGGQAATTTTNSTGTYTFSNVPAGSNYTVTPAKVHYTFAPPTISFSNLGANQTANFRGTLNQHTISGRIIGEGNSSLSGVTVALSGSQSASTTTSAEGRFSFTVLAGGNYTVAPSKTNNAFSPSSASFTDLGGNKVADFTATVIRTLEFSAATYQIIEGETSMMVTLVRQGDTSGPATATYLTSDNSGTEPCSTPDTEVATSGCDYIPSIGTVVFAPGEITKTFYIPIIDDGYAEGSENFTVELTNLSGVNLGLHGTADVLISDNETVNGANTIDRASSFVRQHYIDFFNREPDASGLAFWTSQIEACGNDVACIELKRTNASAAFFLSTEFRETGYLVYRMYKAAYGNPNGAPVPVRLEEFLPDTRQIGLGVIVEQPGWQQSLENNKQAFASEFVTRPAFTSAYPTAYTPSHFVNALFANAGVVPSAEELSAAISEFGSATNTIDVAARGRALRRVAENETLAQSEFNRAFVLMQYFGYFRRNPDEAPEPTLDFQGYNFWLGKLEQFNGNFVKADMVKAFIISGEYRHRFGP